MSKVQQFLKGLEQMTRNKFVTWESSKDFIDKNHNDQLEKFLNSKDIKDNIILDKSYTCNFYNNIVSLIMYEDKGYKIHIQSKLTAEVRGLKSSREDEESLEKYIELILKQI